MVNPESPTFRFSEKVGYIVGKIIKIVVVASVLSFVGGKLTGSRPVQPQRQQPPSTP
jgi:hypothetical protein